MKHFFLIFSKFNIIIFVCFKKTILPFKIAFMVLSFLTFFRFKEMLLQKQNPSKPTTTTQTETGFIYFLFSFTYFHIYFHMDHHNYPISQNKLFRWFYKVKHEAFSPK